MMFKYLRYGASAVAMLCFAAVDAGANAAVLDTSPFLKKIEITASGYSGATTLENFPALVRLSEASGFDFADFTNPAAELRFVDASGNNLDFEIDTWDSTSGTALVWVSIPSLSGTTTKITAYFAPLSTTGLPAVYSTNVWTSAGYVGVWHMREASGTVADSTGHLLDAVPTGATSVSVAADSGVIGDARQTATSNSGRAYLLVPNYDSFACGGVFVASGWFRATGLPQGSGDIRLFSRREIYNTQGGWDILVKNTNNGKEVKVRGDYASNSEVKSNFSPALVGCGWRHIVFVYNGTSASIYTNGVAMSTSGSIKVATDNGRALGIGSYSEGTDQNNYFVGDMDEVRLHKGVESADWILANYATQNDVAFFNYGEAGSCQVSVTWDVGTNGGTMEVGGATVSDSYVETTSAHTPTSPGTPVKANKVFIGWNTDPSATAALDLASFALAGDTTFYAIFVDAVVRWFDADGTTPLDPSETYVSDGARPTHAPAAKKPTLHDRYAFVGWTLVGGGSVVYASDEVPVVSGGETVSYKAVFEVAEHSDTPNVAFLGFAHSNFLAVARYAGTSTLYNFPVLVRISGTAIDGFDYGAMRADGADLAFFDLSGNPLPFEVDTWNTSGESLVWVGLPAMDSDTIFAMYWGSSLVSGKDVCQGNVWNGYVGVWHMNETENGTAARPVAINDSTANGLTGTAKNGSSASSGMIGGARRIANDRDHAPGIVVDVSAGAKKSAADSLGKSFSSSFWMRAIGNSEYSFLISRRKGELGDNSDENRRKFQWGLRLRDAKTSNRVQLFAAGGDSSVKDSGTNYSELYTSNSVLWKKVDVVWRNTGADFYTNGVFVETVAYDEPTEQPDANIGIGCSTQDTYGTEGNQKGRRFDGEMDEVRLSAGTPSAERIKADYDTVAISDFLSAPLTVTWADWNGSSAVVFDTTPVRIGGHPSHGAVTKAADAEHSYEFIGWNTDRTAATGLDLSTVTVSEDTTFYAIWRLHSPGGWVAVNWFEEDGRNPLDPATTIEDAGVAISRADPAKASTAQLEYEFAGWTPVEGGPTNTAAELTWFENGQTYNLKAVYNKTIRKYTLTFLNEDGSPLGSVESDYGTAGGAVAAPVATKPSTHDKIYVFAGWSPRLDNVQSNATYTATYTEVDNLNPASPEGFSRGIEFVVSGYAGAAPLSNFPVLVRLSENGKNGGFSYSETLLPDGEGLRFRLLDGTPLRHEIDTWNPEGESLVWVVLPEMTNGTKFAMYYRTVQRHADNAPVPEGNIWSALDYVGVWHLGEPGDGEVAIHDSTTNHLDGTSAPDIPASDNPAQTLYGGASAAGVVGNSRRIAHDNFHARGIVIDATNGTQKAVADSLSDGDFTASFWMCPEGFKDTEWQWSCLVTRRKGDMGASWGVAMHEKAKGIRVYYGPRLNDNETYAISSAAYNPSGTGEPVLTNLFEDVSVNGRWSKIDVVWRDSALDGYSPEDWPASWYIYHNGELSSYGPLPTRVQREDTNIGIGCATQDEYANVYGAGDGTSGTSGNITPKKGRRFNGEMDEVRIRKCASSADWIKADHDTVANASFLSSSLALVLIEEPELVEVGVQECGDDYCVVTGRVLFVGEPATTSAVRLMVGTSADGLSASVVTNLGYGAFSLRATGLQAGTTYWYAVEEEDGAGLVFTTATNSFTTLAAPSGNVNLTITPGANVVVVSVMVRGEEVVGEDGVYSVPAGLPVTVTFAAAEGYALNGSRELRVSVDADTVLAGDALPTASSLADVIRVNEIMASNGSDGITTENGGPELDWIELYNSSDDDIDVTGWYLSDNAAKPTKDKAKILGNGIVPAHGYKIVWMDKGYADYTENEAYTAVGISASGEDPVVFSTKGKTLIREIHMPAQVKDYSYGIPAGGDGSTFVYFQTPTPGAANVAEGFGPPTPEVTYSVPHGYKTEAFDLALSCADPNAEIRYTLDGTSPTAESALYTAPIRIEHTTIVRAAAPTANSVLQYDSSATYIFLDEVLAQEPSATAPAAAAALGFPNSGAVNSHAMRYGLNQAIVNGTDRARLLNGFTNSIATFSIVIDPANLFNPKTGIYVNPQGEGRAWERFAVLEQINPVNEADGFSIPTGLRLRGGNSRQSGWPKHSFRFFFRSSYGKSQLEHTMFPGDPTEAGKYDKLDLRTSQNVSWANEGTGREDTFIHEVFSRDTQRDLGQPYTRSRYYHLFLNGQYWGLYQTQERGDEHFGEDYLGGDSLEYDLIKTSSDLVNGRVKYSIGANEGTMDAWSNLWDIAVNEGFAGAHADNYTRVQGLYPDGTRNPAYPVLLNPENLMAYMLSTHYTVDTDCPTSPFGTYDPGPGHLNNLYALRNRNDSGSIDGFVFLRHDAELSLGKTSNATSASIDPTFWGTESGASAPSGAVAASATLFRQFDHFNPAELHYKLCENEDYRRAFADYYAKNVLSAGGALSLDKSSERFQKRMAEIDDAIVCEAARWGWRLSNGEVANGAATREKWLTACAGCLTFITNRLSYMTSQYVEQGWYPPLASPQIVDADGNALEDGAKIEQDDKVYIETPAAEGVTVYYTLGGFDPRREDGTVDAGAIAYTGDSDAFMLPELGATVMVRAYAGGVWSALAQLQLDVNLPSDQQLGIRVAAVMSNTRDGGGDGNGEFIVITNLLDRAVSLEGLRITCAKQGEAPKVDFTIGAGVSVAAGSTVKLTKPEYWPDPAKITNGKVDIKVYDENGKDVQTLFIDASWWNNACKGTGEYFEALDFRGYADDKDVTISTEGQWTHVKGEQPTIISVM